MLLILGLVRVNDHGNAVLTRQGTIVHLEGGQAERTVGLNRTSRNAPLRIDWQCGRKVGPGCVAYLTAGLRSLAQKVEGDLGRWQIFVGEELDEPDEIGDRVLFIGKCSVQGEVFANVQRRLYLQRRASDLTVIPSCPPMALRTEIMHLVGLD